MPLITLTTSLTFGQFKQMQEFFNTLEVRKELQDQGDKNFIPRENISTFLNDLQDAHIMKIKRKGD